MSQPAALAEAEKFISGFYGEKEDKSKTPDASGENSPEKSESAPASKNTEETSENTQVQDKNSESAPDSQEDWKHKFDVVNGRIKKESARVKELEEKLAALENLQVAAKSQSELEKVSQETNKAQEELNSALERMRTEYGDEFVQHQKVLARMEAERLLEERLKPLQEKINGVTEVAQRTAEERYMSDLNKAAKNWQEKKDDENFHAWLAEPDQFSGVRRFDMMKDAMMRGDAARVAAFYNAWEPAGKQNATPPKKEMQSKERLFAPASQPTGGIQRDTGQQDETIIKSSDLARFARDVIAGKYVGRDAEMRALQQRYDQAQARGRIVMD